ADGVPKPGFDIDLQGLTMYVGSWSGGIITVSQVDQDASVTYRRYDGSVIHRIPIPAVHSLCGYSAAQGPDGTILFATGAIAGDEGCGPQRPLAVSRFWPSGAVRTWTSNPVGAVEQTGVRAQPDGGAVLMTARSPGT